MMEDENREILYKSLTQAVFDVFSTMTGLEPSVMEQELAGQGEITGAMMVLGRKNALLSLTMTKENAAMIVSLMTGMISDEIADDDLYDGVTELVNMIAGRAKALLAGTGYHYEITPPLTIVGENHFLVFKKQALSLQVRFQVGETEASLQLTYL